MLNLFLTFMGSLGFDLAVLSHLQANVHCLALPTMLFSQISCYLNGSDVNMISCGSSHKLMLIFHEHETQSISYVWLGFGALVKSHTSIWNDIGSSSYSV